MNDWAKKISFVAAVVAAVAAALSVLAERWPKQSNADVSSDTRTLEK